MPLRKRRRVPPRQADSVEALEQTWSEYARDWADRPDLNLGHTTLGEEWGVAGFAERVVAEIAAPYLGPEADVLELGCGGGKFSAHLRPRTRTLVCADISADMLARARAHVGEGEDVSYLQLNGRDFAGVADDSVDFIFSYDVLLHLQPQNVFSYLHAARRVLRPGGVFLIHAINLAAPGGAYHFEVQYVQDTWSRPFEDPHRRGHVYFMSEDQLRALAELGRYSVDRLVTNWPPPGDPMVPAARGRDTLGFLRREPSLHEQMAAGTVRLVRAPDERLFALADGRRREFPMPEIFEQAGLSWEAVQPIDAAELEALPADQPVSRWEL